MIFKATPRSRAFHTGLNFVFKPSLMDEESDAELDLNGEGIARWLVPLADCGELEFADLVQWSESPEDAADRFYPNPVPESIKARLGQLRPVPLLCFGDDDSPYYGYLGAIWDTAAHSGVIFNKGCDQTIRGHVFETLDADTILPLVIGELLVLEHVRLIEGKGLCADSAPDVALDLGMQAGSLVWNATGFEVYDETLVPREKIVQLIHLIYEHCSDGWFCDYWPTPESWLKAAYP
jgi:hypothetical protein